MLLQTDSGPKLSRGDEKLLEKEERWTGTPAVPGQQPAELTLTAAQH